MTEKRYDITAGVQGIQDVDRLRESVEDLGDTVDDLSSSRLDIDVDPKPAEDLAEAFSDVETKAEAAGRTIVELAQQEATELASTRAAADALAAALGPELAAKVDLDTVVKGFTDMGLTLDEVKADADTLAAALKEVDEVKLDGVQGGARNTTARMGELRDTSDQSRSVLANLAGNAAQDLGQVGGVVGSLGVGIGQMAEYAVDGNIKLSNLAAVAGPMVALSGALLLVQQAQAAVAAEEAFHAEQVDAYREAVDELGPSLDAVEERLGSIGDVDFSEQSGGLDQIGAIIGALGTTAANALTPWEELSGEISNFPAVLGSLGIGFEEVATIIAGGQPALDAFKERLEDMPEAEGLTGPIMDILRGQQEAYAEAIGVSVEALDEQGAAQQVAAQEAAFYATSIAGVEQALQKFDDQQMHTNELWNVVIGDIRDGNGLTQQGVDAWNRLKVVLGETDAGMTAIADQKIDELLDEEARAAEEAAQAELEHQEALIELGRALVEVADNLDSAKLRADAWATAMEQANAASELTATQEVIAFVGAMDGLGESLRAAAEAGVDLNAIDLVPDSWGEITGMPEELGPVVDALAGFREQIQSEMAQAFEVGGPASVRAWAEDTEAAVRESLAEAGVTSEAAVQEILSALGLLPDQIDMAIAVSGQEQAMALLGLLGSAIEGLPTEVQLQIAAVAATDPLAALELAIQAFSEAGIAVPVELTAEAERLRADIAAVEAEPHSTTVDTELETGDAESDMHGFTSTQRTAVVDAEADTKVANEDLNATAVPRTAPFNISLLQLLIAEVQLTVLARARTAEITANALTAAAEAELNNVARDRTAVIRTYTVGGGGTGGGGPFGAFQTEPGPGPRGARGARGALGPLGEELPSGSSSSSSGGTLVLEAPATEVNVTIQAGVIGNGFDVERAVYDAVQDAVRFRGQRQVLTVAGRNS